MCNLEDCVHWRGCTYKAGTAELRHMKTITYIRTHWNPHKKNTVAMQSPNRLPFYLSIMSDLMIHKYMNSQIAKNIITGLVCVIIHDTKCLLLQ